MTRVAVIDDNNLVGESFTRLLQCGGYESAYYDSAEAFLQTDEPRNAECLVIDYHMAGMDGVQLVEHLRATHIRTPVVLISGNMGRELDGFTDAFEHVETLSKPCRSKALFESVERVVAKANTLPR